MSDYRDRPGGLTALAVINFIFAGLGFLGILGTIVIISLVMNDQVEGADEGRRQMARAWEEMPVELVLLTTLALASHVLLLLSGLGYLKLKRVKGRALGNAYAVVSITHTVIAMMLTPEEAGGGQVNLWTLVGFLYPAVTLIMLNTTFKDDFVN